MRIVAIIAALTVLIASATATSDYKTVWRSIISTYGAKNSETTKVASDSNGYIYTASVYHKTVSDDDVVVRKYNSTGTLQWAVTVTGTTAGHDSPAGFAFDSNNNAYFAATVYHLYQGLAKPYSHITRFAANGTATWSFEESRKNPTGIAVYGDGATGKIGICGYGTRTNGTDGVYFRQYSNDSGTFQSVLESGGTTMEASNAAVDGNGIFVFSFILDGNCYFYRWSASTGLLSNTLIDTNTSLPAVGFTKNTGRPSIFYNQLGYAWNVVTNAVLNGNAILYQSAFGADDPTGPAGFAVRSDDRIASAGTIAFAGKRYPSWFTGYGNQTSATTGPGYFDCVMRDIKNDGHLLLQMVGTAFPVQAGEPNFLVSALDSNPYLDPVAGEANALTILPDGDVVAVGYLKGVDASHDPVIVRLSPNVVAYDDTYDITGNMTYLCPAPGVYWDDFGSAGCVSAVTIAPLHGTAVLYSDGSFTYTPNNGFVGTDTFKYRNVKGGITASAFVHLKVHPYILSLSLSASSVVGGSIPVGTVHLSQGDAVAPYVVALSDNSSAANEPASVSIPINTLTGTFSVSTAPVAADQLVTISATHGSTKTAQLHVVPPSITSLVLTPSNLHGGNPFSGAVTLNGKAYALGATIIVSVAGANVSVPPTLVIAGGSKTGTFNGTTSAVATTQMRTITTTYAGSTKTATLTLQP